MVQHHAVYTHPGRTLINNMVALFILSLLRLRCTVCAHWLSECTHALEVSLWMPCNSGVACEMVSMG